MYDEHSDTQQQDSTRFRAIMSASHDTEGGGASSAAEAVYLMVDLFLLPRIVQHTEDSQFFVFTLRNC